MKVVAAPERPPESVTALFPFAYGQRPDDVALLAQHVFLSRLPPRDLAALLPLLDEVAYPSEASVFHEGDASEHLHFVLEGSAKALRGDAAIARFGVGDHFGASALLGPGVRTYSVVAEGGLRLARLPRARLLALGAVHPHIMDPLLEAVQASVQSR